MALKVPCPQCGKVPPPECNCPPLPPGPPDPVPESEPRKPAMRPEVLKLRREKRNGRDVIVIDGAPPDLDLQELARALKTRLATGGTVKGRTIEIQGDHRDAMAAFLLERGFRSKRAGG
jgi:translation initiation factor 1